jgi:hypothetical protein
MQLHYKQYGKNTAARAPPVILSGSITPVTKMSTSEDQVLSPVAKEPNTYVCVLYLGEGRSDCTQGLASRCGCVVFLPSQ